MQQLDYTSIASDRLILASIASTLLRVPLFHKLSLSDCSTLAPASALAALHIRVNLTPLQLHASFQLQQIHSSISPASSHLRSNFNTLSFQHQLSLITSWFQFQQVIISSSTQLQNSRLARLPGLTTACIATCTTPAAFSSCFSLPNLFSTLIQFVPHHQLARFTALPSARSLHGSTFSSLASRFKPQLARFTVLHSPRSLHGSTFSSLASRFKPQLARFMVLHSPRSLHGSTSSSFASRFKPQLARFTVLHSSRSLHSSRFRSLDSQLARFTFSSQFHVQLSNRLHVHVLGCPTAPSRLTPTLLRPLRRLGNNYMPL